MLSSEERKRVAKFKPTFYKYLREGTVEHCKKLYKAGMIEEALEIGKEFNIKEEELCGDSWQ